MITHQEAQAWLDTRKDQEWRARCHATVTHLDPSLHSMAYHLLGYTTDGKPLANDQKHIFYYNMPQDNRRWQAISQLDQLTTTERQVMFRLVFPTLAPWIEYGWQLQKQLPYPTGSLRRAFHAPHRPELTLNRRVSWFNALFQILAPYNLDIVEVAQWSPYLSYGHFGQFVGVLLAAAMNQHDATGDEVFRILCASARGEHEIGVMGRHVTQALLTASHPEGWAVIEQLLLVAQRQEGLRQVILETVDEAHPQAFRRMIQLIHEQNMCRFNSVIRAIDVWLGLGLDVTDKATASGMMAELNELFQNAAAISTALASNNPQKVYLALWTIAYEDAEKAVAAAIPFLTRTQVELRFVATYLLAQLGLPQANTALLPQLLDEDIRVAATALPSAQYARDPHIFGLLEKAWTRFPEKARELTFPFWPWLTITVHRGKVADALALALDTEPLERLLPYFTHMTQEQRSRLSHRLKQAHEQGDAAARHILLQLLGDPSQWVRQNAVEAMANIRLRPEELPIIEALLVRKASDLRRHVLQVLSQQVQHLLLSSIERLLTARNERQNEAGHELLRQLHAKEPDNPEVQKLIQQFKPVFPELANLYQSRTHHIPRPELASLQNGLGLFDPSQRTQPIPPKSHTRWLGKSIQLSSPAAAALIQSLDNLIDQHATTPITFLGPDGQQHEILLGNFHLGFPLALANVPETEDTAQLPLREVWENWWRQRPSHLRDKDGLELLRALAMPASLTHRHYRRNLSEIWFKNLFEAFWGKHHAGYKYPRVLPNVLWWLVRLFPPPGAVNFLLDAVEHSLTLLPTKVEDLEEARTNQFWATWINTTRQYLRLRPADWNHEHHRRWWLLLRWLDEPVAGSHRLRPDFDVVWQAYQNGFATSADLLDHLIGPHHNPYGMYGGRTFNSLNSLSGRKPLPHSGQFATHPEVQTFVAQCRERIIAVETQRGDMPTAATLPALALRYSGGLDSLIAALSALGEEGFFKGWATYHHSKAATLSHLIHVTFPGPEDTPERFAAAIKLNPIPEKRLIETAFYAPQWTRHIEHTLQWVGLAEAVWWFHAHTKDRHWTVEQEIRDTWSAEVSERTPLNGNELMDGAVDVTWFQQVYATMGEKQWAKLDAAAKYTSGGTGHTRARLFAQAMLGQISRETVAQRIKEKRNQDAVRALGLLPLPQQNQQEEILARYMLIQEFLRGIKQFGSQRQASEKLCAQIGLENLARTAGFPDPLRLEWAVERHAVADLMAGPVVVTVDAVTVTLSIDPLGEPHITTHKQGRSLKDVPGNLKKHPAIIGLNGRKNDLRQQARRTRSSLEQAMCRGDVFMASELQELLHHPILRPQLEDLVFLGDRVIGYPIEGGKALLGTRGRVQPLHPDTPLCLAHPYDFLLTNEWHLWQAECFQQEHIQPFKQLFRELYIITPAERETGLYSRRYAGQQINPGQTLALLGQRGWVAHVEEGIRKTFHEANITAWLTTANGLYTPAEMGGITLENITFTRRGEWHSLPLTEIPARLFSEVMRDVDLVVSVAHLGGVDPEASMSSIEIRGNLVQETVAMLKLNNVEVKNRHVIIAGELNRYSVHLGSGVVHQQPGGYVCIIPVHSQHRGRVFLPFFDDDPKTAEIIAKVILLARDKQIKDPTILEQIMPRT